jgi:hypothetical protein
VKEVREAMAVARPAVWRDIDRGEGYGYQNSKGRIKERTGQLKILSS